ncbi:polysaccharide deacetylase family protein [Flavobacterium caeni]|uniref:Peptidoglycan/xylan/chitin deacetylase, PgdA/CDA1 family n=1 Tax=Flavobacterium caeni TaxID=490189 RepID=A0A1G5IIT6_9FLAO|nr:polysaccharide deacetylase family protein [Flavobacterium caeni]SCY75328.1 Peptidoglycan/xylan/chitin deacetylase, PgdA/CDA1 family [Flavobacterium caeni]
MKLWIKTHPLVKWLFPKYVWDFKTNEKVVWLTFDDGPIPEVTEWVLDQLARYDAKAAFFCIGDNIRKHPAVLQKVLAAGHSIGNHTFNHLKGWETETAAYIENVRLCAEEITKHTANVSIMRPPYGKIKRKQAQILRKAGYKIIMWDIVSADFDLEVTPEQCLQNVVKNVQPGSIIVFHDSVKASKNLRYALPKTLEFLAENGYRCEVPDQICS